MSEWLESEFPSHQQIKFDHCILTKLIQMSV